jgi:hypothetical protein
MSFSLPDETLFSLELALDLSDPQESTAAPSPIPSFFDVVVRLLRNSTSRIYGSLQIVVFKARSIPFHQILADMRPTTSIIGVPASR